MNNLLKTVLVCVLAIFLSCKGNQNSSQNSSPDTTAAATDTLQHASAYTCPMHPEVVSDKPGTCPKCGMTLEQKS